MRLYKNGTEVASLSLAAWPGPSDEPWLIGREFLSEPCFAGCLDELKIWNVVRTPSQIQSGLYSKLTGTESGLVGYWNFDDETANDLTAYGNHGVLHNGASVGMDGTSALRIRPAFELAFLSGSPFCFYQLQGKEKVGDGTWTNVGAPVRGTGQALSFFVTAEDSRSKFFRLIPVQ